MGFGESNGAATLEAENPSQQGRAIDMDRKDSGSAGLVAEVAAEAMAEAVKAVSASAGSDSKAVNPRRDQLSEITVGVNGSNLLNRDIRNSASYSKDQVLMPGASVRVFASVKY